MIYWVLGLTLVVGTLLSFQTPSLIVFYGAYYGLCLFALRSINYGKDFFLSFSSSTVPVPEQKIMVAGENVAPRMEEDQQENRFLNIFASERIIKRRVLTWLLFFAGLWFFHFKQGVEISVNTMVPLLSCVLIVNSFYVGHFLTTLLLNLLMVVYTYSSEVIFPFYLVYGCLFLTSLYFVGTKKESIDLRKIVQLMTLSTLLLGLTYGFSWFLPENLSFDEPRLEMKTGDSKLLRDQLRKMKVDLGRMQMKLPPGKTADLLSQIGVLEQMSQKPLTQKEREEARGLLRNSMEQFRNFKEEVEGQIEITLPKGYLSALDKETLMKLKARNSNELNLDEQNRQLQDLTRETENIQSQLLQVNLNEEDKQKLQGKLEELTEAAQMLKTPDDLTLKEKDMVQGFVNRNPDQDMSEVERLLKKNSLTLEERQQLVKELETLGSQNAEVPSTTLSEIKPETESALLKTLGDEKKEEQSLVDRLHKLLPLLVGAFIIIFLNYLLRRKGIKKVEGADPVVLEELREEWKKLKKLKLSPRDEVIHYYNMFHHSLQKMHYADQETPPSCIVYEDMKEFNPSLEKSTLVMTEVFAHCFYGSKDVSQEALKIFRKAVNKTLKVYQLT